MIGYYRWFVQNYGSTVGPLTQLLKNGASKWHEEANESFEKLKTATMTLPVLAMPDLNLPFEIETNVSGYGVRAVLTQAKRPIVYFSRTLSTRDRARPVYERELIAVVFAMQRWRPYLLERKFIVKTDQRSLKFLLEQCVIQLQYQKWIAKRWVILLKWFCRLGLENKAADALSRVSPTVHLNQITAPALLDLAIIREEVENDPRLKEIKSIVEQYLDDIPNFNSRAG